LIASAPEIMNFLVSWAIFYCCDANNDCCYAHQKLCFCVFRSWVFTPFTVQQLWRIFMILRVNLKQWIYHNQNLLLE